MEMPEDIMVEILSRLSAKSLLRFKCVCRQWRTLISSPSFAHLHLNRSVSNPTILVSDANHNGPILHLDLVSFAPVERSNLQLDSFNDVFLVGSINGLVCLVMRFYGQILILNPSTRFVKQIPTIPTGSDCMGFGWDPTANDYKVFRFCFGGPAWGNLVQVWSTNLQYWRQYETDRNMLPVQQPRNLLIMEAFNYFLVHNVGELQIKRMMIACFEVKNELLRFIPIPQLLKSSFFLMNWKGTIAVVALSKSWAWNEYQVWTMDDDRIGRECWSKKFTFRPTESFALCYGFATSVKGTQIPVSLSGELILFDLQTRETIYSEISAYYHVESLLSIP